MKLSSLLRHAQSIGLAISTTILMTEAVVHYRNQIFASDIRTKIDDALLSQSSRLPLASPTPQPTEEQSRVVSFGVTHILDQEKIAAAQESFLGSTPSATIQNIHIYRLRYEIKGVDQTWKSITASVFIPSGDQKYPLFVFGAGTTGIADSCAPSLEKVAIENLGNYENHMITQAAAGFVAILPDYEGYSDPQATEAYFISDSEANVLIGAVESLLTLHTRAPVLKSVDMTNVFLAGFSQGGHAALSTAKAWQRLPDTVQLRGVIQYAGAANVRSLFTESPWLAPYLTASFHARYGSPLDPKDAIQEKWFLEMEKNNASLCVNQAYRYYPHSPPEMYTPAFVDALESNTWPLSLRNWEKVIQTNTPMSDLPNVPYLSIQGASDPIVTAKTQKENVRSLCEQGKQVLYQEYTGINHFRVRQAGFHLTVQWIKDILENQTLASSCQ